MATPLAPEESHVLKRELLDVMQQNGGMSYASAKAIGVPYKTVHYWMQNDPDFMKEYEEIKERILDRMEMELIQRATMNKDRDACLLFYLKTRGKHRGYVERTETTGANGAPLTNEVTFKVAEADVDLVERIKMKAIEEYKAGLIDDQRK
jgi:hypothetical protein